MGGKRLNLTPEQRKYRRAQQVKASRMKARMLNEERYLLKSAAQRWIWRHHHPEATKKEAEAKKSKRLKIKIEKDKKLDEERRIVVMFEARKLLRKIIRC